MTPRSQEPNESTDDAVWQDLVARLEQTPPAPDSGGEDAPERSVGAGMSDQDRVRAVFENQPLRPPGGPRDYAPREPDDDADDGGYQPPEPPGLGVGEPLLVLAWLGAVGGPVILLLLAMFWRGAPLVVLVGVVTIFLVSVTFLILRLPKSRDYDDDGAEV